MTNRPVDEHHDLDQLWSLAREGDPQAAERVLDRLQASGPARAELLRSVHAAVGRAHRVGLAGPPRAGKSTLLAQLVAHHAARSERVGIVSVDATGAGGGLMLGERVRRNALEMAEGILLRSIEVGPGSEDPALLAGLVADGMDALGCDPVFLESVGLGKAQLEVVRRADTVLLLVPPDVETPERLIEAGLLGVADVVAVNKSDQPRAASIVDTLRQGAEALELAFGDWRPRVLAASAMRGKGIEDVVAALAEHQRYLQESGELRSRRRRRARAQLSALFVAALRQRIAIDPALAEVLDALAERIVDHAIDPASAAARLAEGIELPRP